MVHNYNGFSVTCGWMVCAHNQPFGLSPFQYIDQMCFKTEWINMISNPNGDGLGGFGASGQDCDVLSTPEPKIKKPSIQLVNLTVVFFVACWAEAGVRCKGPGNQRQQGGPHRPPADVSGGAWYVVAIGFSWISSLNTIVMPFVTWLYRWLHGSVLLPLLCNSEEDLDVNVDDVLAEDAEVCWVFFFCIHLTHWFSTNQMCRTHSTVKCLSVVCWQNSVVPVVS